MSVEDENLDIGLVIICDFDNVGCSLVRTADVRFVTKVLLELHSTIFQLIERFH